MNQPASKTQLLASLPPPWPTDLRPAIRARAAASGVPVWRLGPESRFLGLPYVVFPGNVGDARALSEVQASHSSPRIPAGDSPVLSQP